MTTDEAIQWCARYYAEVYFTEDENDKPRVILGSEHLHEEVVEAPTLVEAVQQAEERRCKDRSCHRERVPRKDVGRGLLRKFVITPVELRELATEIEAAEDDER